MPKVSRLEVISTGARRRWTLAEKQRIVAESYDGHRQVSATARRNGLSASQLFTWRRLAREGRADALAPERQKHVQRTADERCLFQLLTGLGNLGGRDRPDLSRPRRDRVAASVGLI